MTSSGTTTGYPSTTCQAEEVLDRPGRARRGVRQPAKCRPMMRARRHAFTALRLILAAGMLVYLSSSGAISWVALGGLAQAWPLALLAFLILFADHTLAAWRLC